MKNSTINGDMGTKRECIHDLRKVMLAAQTALDQGKLHTAIHLLQTGTLGVIKKMPREKMTKPFRS